MNHFLLYLKIKPRYKKIITESYFIIYTFLWTMSFKQYKEPPVISFIDGSFALSVIEGRKPEFDFPLLFLSHFLIIFQCLIHNWRICELPITCITSNLSCPTIPCPSKNITIRDNRNRKSHR